MAAAMSVAEIKSAIDEVGPTMDKLLSAAGHKDAQMVAIRDQIISLLEKTGLMYTTTLHPTLVGVHPDNRYGDGVVPCNVHELAKNLFTNGFSFAECAQASAMEMPPHAELPEVREKYIAFNKKITDGSAGLLPPYKADVHVVSVTCGHCNQALRCVDAQSPSDDSAISEEGRLSLTKIAQKDHAYGRAVREGIPWRVVRWQAEQRFPLLAIALQEAGNLGQQVAKAETRAEVMMKMHKAAQRQFLSKGEVSWDVVMREASRGSSPFASELKDLCECVRKLSGGVDEPIFLNEYMDFLRQLKQQRTVRGSIFGAIAAVDMGPADAPLFKWAVAKAIACASDKYCGPNGEVTLIKVGDISAMSSKHKPFVLQGEKLLSESRKLFATSGASSVSRAALLGLLDCRVVHHIFQRPDPARGSFKSLNDIGHMFVQDLASVAGKTLASPWTATTSTASSSACALATAKACPPMKTFTSSGGIADSASYVKSHGFDVGGLVEKKMVVPTMSSKAFQLMRCCCARPATRARNKARTSA